MWVRYSQCMHLVSRLCCQKFWRLVNNYVIHATLHRAKKVIVKVWHVDSLVNDQVERPPCLWVSVSYHPTYSLVSLTSKGLVVSYDCHWSIVVKDNKSMPA